MTAGEVYRRVSKQTTTATRELAEVRHKTRVSGDRAGSADVRGRSCLL
jgi:hypothetical protein